MHLGHFAKNVVHLGNIVLLQGRIVEEGSPQELLARGGRYAELWVRQASLDDVAAPDARSAANGAASDGDDKEQARYQ